MQVNAGLTPAKQTPTKETPAKRVQLQFASNQKESAKSHPATQAKLVRIKCSQLI